MPNLKSVRLRLVATDGPKNAIRIAVLVRDTKILPDHEYCGVWEDTEIPSEKSICPFVLRKKHVDFGTDYDGDDRFWTTNLCEKPCVIDEYTTWIDESSREAWTFRITHVTELVVGAD